MEHRLRRRIIGTLAGFVAAFAIIYLIELAQASAYPAPSVDPSDQAALTGMVMAMPFAAQAIVVLAWIAGPLLGTLVALRIDHWDPSAYLVTGLFVLVGLLNILGIPHPAWMQVAALVAPVAGGVTGLGLSRQLLARRYARGRVHNSGERGAGG